MAFYRCGGGTSTVYGTVNAVTGQNLVINIGSDKKFVTLKKGTTIYYLYCDYSVIIRYVSGGQATKYTFAEPGWGTITYSNGVLTIQSGYISYLLGSGTFQYVAYSL